VRLGFVNVPDERLELHGLRLEPKRGLQDLQKAGKSNAEIWAEVEAQLGRYKGAMADTEKTGDGLMAALKTRWDNIVRAFGMAWADEAKGGMQTVLDKIKEIESDGTLAAWAAKIGEMVREAVAAVKALHAALHEVGTDLPTDKFDRARGKSDGVLQFFGNAWAGLGATGAWLRGLVVPGENARENYHAYAALHGYGQWADANARELSRYNKARGEWHDDIDIREENEKHIAEVKAEAVKKAATIAEVAEKAAAKRATEEKERLQKSLAEGQKKIDVEVAKKAAEEQEKQDKKTLARRIRDMRRLQAEGSRMASEAQAAQAEAQSKLQQAWGWYRDKGSMAAQLEEEKAEAQAEAQFEKDFARLQRKYGRNWRDAEGLSIGDEAVRRVAIAREEADEADRYAEATARASQDCAASLARLEKILEDGGRE